MCFWCAWKFEHSDKQPLINFKLSLIRKECDRLIDLVWFGLLKLCSSMCQQRKLNFHMRSYMLTHPWTGNQKKVNVNNFVGTDRIYSAIQVFRPTSFVGILQKTQIKLSKTRFLISIWLLGSIAQCVRYDKYFPFDFWYNFGGCVHWNRMSQTPLTTRQQCSKE